MRTCKRCPRYSTALGRCLEGKINPPTITGGREAAKLMGLSYICTLSPLRDKILQSFRHDILIREAQQNESI